MRLIFAGILLTVCCGGRAAAQAHWSGAIGAGRLRDDAAADATGIGTMRVNAAVRPNLDLGLVGHLGFRTGTPTGGRWLYTAALLAGVSTGMNQPRPWAQIAAGGALVPASCKLVLLHLAPPSGAGGAGPGPFDDGCGHEIQGAAAASAGLNIPVGRYLLGPEVTVVAATGRRRFRLASLGVALRF